MQISKQTAEDFPGIEFTGQSLKIVENFVYTGATIGARGGVFDSVITVIRSGRCKFRDLVRF